MVEPAHVGNFFLLFVSAAAVILLGAAYAAVFALAAIRNLRRLMPYAYLAYAGLCAATLSLAYAANLYTEQPWMALIVTMLIGYLLAPHAVLRLCRATHGDTEGASD